MAKKNTINGNLAITLATLKDRDNVAFVRMANGEAALTVVDAETPHVLSGKTFLDLVDKAKKGKSDLLIVEQNFDRVVIFHENHKKAVRKLLNIEQKNEPLPEGAVKFPHENVIVLDARADMSKEREKFLKRLEPTVTSYLNAIGSNFKADISDGSIGFRHDGDYYVGLALDAATLDLVWYVAPNSTKAKYAWTFGDFGGAMAKLIAMVEPLKEKQKKAA